MTVARVTDVVVRAHRGEVAEIVHAEIDKGGARAQQLEEAGG